MIRRAALLGVGLCLCLWLASAALGGDGRGVASPCGPAGAHTLAAGRLARVYAVGAKVYGCAAGARHTYLLGTRSFCEGASRVGPVVVAGELAAYGLERCFVDTGSTDVIVRRLSDGKQMRAAPATTPPGVESFQSVPSLVLRADGAVAWIGYGSSIVGHGPKTIDVYAAQRHGPLKLLDSGPAVAPGSLRLHGSRLSWRHGQSTQHATLS